MAELGISYGKDYPDPLAPNGAELLDDVAEFIARFCVFPTEYALTAVTLWAAHAHMVTHFHTTPRLAMLSPEPESGKTRVLEVLDLLTPDPMLIYSPTPAAIFRTLANKQVTLLFDDVDAIFTKHGKDDSNEDLRGLLNVGYRRSATVPRCVGPRHDVEQFPVFAATALAGLGDLPDTIMTRAVIIRMRRRAFNEHCEQFRLRMHEAPGHEMRAQLRAWADEVAEKAGDAWPELPAGVVDRAAECWEPLLAVADQAGGHWPQTARAACIELCKVVEDRQASLGIRLLTDLRAVFNEHEVMSTEQTIIKLRAIDEAPWDDLYGKGLNARGLAQRLRQYGVSSTKVKVDGKALQGYRREDLWDSWTRYLCSVPAEAEPPEPSRSQPYTQVPLAEQVPEPDSHPEPSDRALTSTVPQVPDLRDPNPCSDTTHTPKLHDGRWQCPDCERETTP